MNKIIKTHNKQTNKQLIRSWAGLGWVALAELAGWAGLAELAGWGDWAGWTG